MLGTLCANRGTLGRQVRHRAYPPPCGCGYRGTRGLASSGIEEPARACPCVFAFVPLGGDELFEVGRGLAEKPICRQRAVIPIAINRLGDASTAATGRRPYPTISVDGAIGPTTGKAIRAVQKARGLTGDGVVGPATWAVLQPYS